MRAVTVFYLPIALAFAVAPEAAPQTGALRCVVARVIDGDTIECRGGRRVRLLLIDTPELSQAPFGRQARAAALRAAPVGTTVTLETDVQLRDQYGRTLAYVRLPDGSLLNERLLREGMAIVSVYPPNVKLVDRFRSVADSARAARRGLWGVDAFECTPAAHRRGRCE